MRFTVRPRARRFIGMKDVRDAIGNQAICTINALPPDVHRGANTRYGRPGRIPDTVNVPASGLVGPEDHTLRSPEQIAAVFEPAGDANAADRVIVYCGGGIAATLDAFALYQLGYEDIAVYDGSMSEWARDDSLPMEVG